jgi:hypothetical protein
MFAGFGDFERFLAKKSTQVKPALSAAVRDATIVVYAKAYETFGDKSKLQELAPATIRHREYLMTQIPTVGGSDSPLLFTGKLRSELEWAHEGLIGGVGSPDPIMQWQELGTARIPPRPLLRLSAESAKEAAWLVVRHYAAELIGVAAEGGGNIYTSEIGEGRNVANMFTGALKKRL